MMGAAVLRRVDASVVAIVTTCATAWALVALVETGLLLLPLCSSGATRILAPSIGLAVAYVLSSPAQIAASWLLMLAAMMLPVMVPHIRHIHLRSFKERQTRSKLQLLLGYLAVWMAAGVALEIGAVAVRVALPGACVEVVVGLALLWQVSPAKQWCLNRCHQKPALAAFGARADLDAVRYGSRLGAACVGSCWALMTLPLVVERHHLAVMIVVAILIYAERLESPAPLSWRWRGVGKALRIVSGQLRMRLGSRPMRKTVFFTS